MGRINVVVSDELYERFRLYLHRKYGWKAHGRISEFVARAVERELDRLEESGK